MSCVQECGRFSAGVPAGVKTIKHTRISPDELWSLCPGAQQTGTIETQCGRHSETPTHQLTETTAGVEEQPSVLFRSEQGRLG